MVKVELRASLISAKENDQNPCFRIFGLVMVVQKIHLIGRAICQSKSLRYGQNKMETTTTSKISESKATLRVTSKTVQKLMNAGKIKSSNLNDGLLVF
jgi:hypothetical protein